MIRPPPRSTLSLTTLFRSNHFLGLLDLTPYLLRDVVPSVDVTVVPEGRYEIGRARLNSSHANISYAVFCLKKKRHPRRQVTEVDHSLMGAVCTSLADCIAE